MWSKPPKCATEWKTLPPHKFIGRHMFHKLLWYSLAALRGAIVWWALWIECVPAKTKWLSVTIHDHNMRINLFNSPHPLPCHSTPGDPGRHFVTPFGRTWMHWEMPGVQQTSPEWIMSLIMRYRLTWIHFLFFSVFAITKWTEVKRKK